MTEDPRISEIRAVAGEWRNAGLTDEDAMRRVCAILDRPAPAPQVFFPGDTVPAESAVMDGDGRVLWSPNDWTADASLLDVDVPSLEEWQAAADQARDSRAGNLTRFGERVLAVAGGCEHIEHPAENATTICGAATEQGKRLCPWHAESP